MRGLKLSSILLLADLIAGQDAPKASAPPVAPLLPGGLIPQLPSPKSESTPKDAAPPSKAPAPEGTILPVPIPAPGSNLIPQLPTPKSESAPKDAAAPSSASTPKDTTPPAASPVAGGILGPQLPSPKNSSPPKGYPPKGFPAGGNGPPPNFQGPKGVSPIGSGPPSSYQGPKGPPSGNTPKGFPPGGTSPPSGYPPKGFPPGGAGAPPSGFPSKGVPPGGNAPSAGPACKVVEGDKDYPADDVWQKELSGVKKQPKADKPHPAWLVTAKKIEDVQAAVKFASKYNVRFSVINSGHDFLGRNDAPSGLWLLVGNLKGVKVLSSFTASPNGTENVDFNGDPIVKANTIQPVAGQQAAVTLGVGVTTQEMHDALDKSGLFAIGPAVSTARPAGGYSQSSGHSPLSSKFGLGADNVLEYKVVTADGQLKIANSVSNQQLFWALRGGGGGTFGVVVQATFKAYPTPKVTQVKFWIETQDRNDTKSIYDPSAYFHTLLPALNNRGWQGYYYIYPYGLQIRFISIDSSVEEAKQTFLPVLGALSTFPGLTKPIHQCVQFKSFKEWFDTFFGALPPLDAKAPVEDEGANPRGVATMDSRLLGVQHLTAPNLSQALREAMPKEQGGMLRGHLVGGGAVFKGKGNSVNPAWRRAYVHLIATGKGANATSLRQLAPDMGSYSNEASTSEPNWKRSMWGNNYNQLRQIKARVDPAGIFWVTPGIGADDWKLANGKLCRVQRGQGPQSPQSLTPPENDNKNKAGAGGAKAKGFPKSQEEADQRKGDSWP